MSFAFANPLKDFNCHRRYRCNGSRREEAPEDVRGNDDVYVYCVKVAK